MFSRFCRCTIDATRVRTQKNEATARVVIMLRPWLVASCLLPGLQPTPSVIPRTPVPLSCATPSAAPSLRQRLRETPVDPWLQAEVNAIVLHKKAGMRSRSPTRSPADAAFIAEPLENPFGTKPVFVASADSLSSLPPEGLPEVAFIGRSNVGKSSLLNAITGVTALARVSDKPGRTQALNFFQLGQRERAFLAVDMPGYGFAFAKDSAVERWRELSAEYLRQRKTLKLVLVLLDAKIGLKFSDLQMLAFLEDVGVKYTVVLTKADAAGPPDRAAKLAALTLASVRRARHFVRPAAYVSSRTGAGIGRLQRRVLESAVGWDPLAHVDGGWDLSKRAVGERGRGAAAAGRGAAVAGVPALGRGRGASGAGAARGRGVRGRGVLGRGGRGAVAGRGARGGGAAAARGGARGGRGGRGRGRG